MLIQERGVEEVEIFEPLMSSVSANREHHVLVIRGKRGIRSQEKGEKRGPRK
jgi:hypothetical protein